MPCTCHGADRGPLCAGWYDDGMRLPLVQAAVLILLCPLVSGQEKELFESKASSTPLSEEETENAQEKRWLQETGFGLMFHYEAFRNHTSESYNETIDSFYVPGFAEAVESTRCGHVIFVIGQHWGKYCAPNSAYEKLLV